MKLKSLAKLAGAAIAFGIANPELVGKAVKVAKKLGKKKGAETQSGPGLPPIGNRKN